MKALLLFFLLPSLVFAVDVEQKQRDEYLNSGKQHVLRCKDSVHPQLCHMFKSELSPKASCAPTIMPLSPQKSKQNRPSLSVLDNIEGYAESIDGLFVGMQCIQ